MTPPKLMLTIVAGGVLLGALGGQMARPVMKFTEDPDRRSRFESQFSETPAQFADAGPEDLNPLGWFGPGYTRPAEYVPPADYAPSVDYAPPPTEDYAVANEPTPHQPAEVEQASADATETAAVLTDPQSASVSRAASTSEAATQAPLAGCLTSPAPPSP